MSLSAYAHTFKEFDYNKVFVETGTFGGGGVQMALYAGFKEIHTLEANKKLYMKVKKKFGHKEDWDKEHRDANVYFYYGDSSVILWDVIKKINEPITFWLDSHWFEESKPRGVKNVPILEEISAIAKHSIKTHTILIDDRAFLGGVWDEHWIASEWSDLSEDILRQAILDINPNYTFIYRDSRSQKDGIIVAGIAV